MKRIAVAFLLAGLMLCCVSCNNDIDDVAVNTSDTSVTTDTSSQKEPEDTLFNDYNDVLDVLVSLGKNGGRENFENMKESLNERERNIYSELYGSYNFSCGIVYYLCDINEDGNDELVLTLENSDYRRIPRSIFTMHLDKPVLIESFGNGNHEGAIDENGNIYKQGYGKGENCYYYVKQIEGKELTGLEFGCNDDNVDDAEVGYYKEENGVRSSITKGELDALVQQYFSDFEPRFAIDDSHGGTLVTVGENYKIFRSYYKAVYSDRAVCEIYDKDGNFVKKFNSSGYMLVNDQEEDIILIDISDTSIFYDIQNNRTSEEFTSYIWDFSKDKMIYGDGSKVVLRDIFDRELFYREFDSGVVISPHLSPDGKSMEYRRYVSGNSEYGRYVMCFEEDLSIVVTKKLCYVRKEAKIGDNIVHFGSGNPQYMRAESVDTARLISTVAGGEYTSDDGTVRNDWHKIVFNGEECYVTADSFEVIPFSEYTVG